MPKLKRKRSLRKGKYHKAAKRREWLRNMLIKKYDGKCAICGEPVNLVEGDPHYATTDHITPVSKGGRYSLDNLQLAHHICNRNKGDTLPENSC